MRIAWTSPMSSVTWWLSSGAGQSGPVAVGRPPCRVSLGAEERGGGRRVDRGEGPEGPREGLLDVGVRVADELRQEREAAAHGGGPLLREAPDVGEGRDRRADEPALPARGRVDELLELSPAVGLREDAAGDRVREAVDRDPLGRAAGLRPDEVPGEL